ncbi:uncharacterized protein LOC142342824 isoform X2 [Convolutriloba macropyga]
MYLAEATLFWLRYRLMREPYLRASEVKLFKAGELVFDRLMGYYVMGDLIGHEDFLKRLRDYNDGFSAEVDESYSSYPTIVQSLSYISHVVNFISSGIEEQIEDRAEQQQQSSAEQSQYKSLPYLFNQSNVFKTTDSDLCQSNPMLWYVLDLQIEKSPVLMQKIHGNTKDNTISDKPNILRAHHFRELAKLESVSLIHSLKLLASIAAQNMTVLRTFQKLAFTQNPETCSPHVFQTIPDVESSASESGCSGRSQNDLINHNLKSSFNGTNDNDAMHRSSILDELRSLELSVDEELPNSESRLVTDGMNEMPSTNRSERSILSTARMQTSLEQIKETESPPVGGVHGKDENFGGKQPVELKANPLQHSEESRAPSKSLVTEEDIAWDNLALVDRHLWNNAPFYRRSNMTDQQPASPPINREDLLALNGTKSRTNFLNGRPSEARSSRLFAGSPKNGIHLDVDSPRSSRSDGSKSWPNFSEWPSEVAIAYTKMMAQIVEKGCSADIRKAALLGAFNDDVLFNTKKYSYQNLSTKNVGLIDLLYFSFKECVWCWQVRFTALECLMRLYNRLETLPNQDGIRNICWAAILDACNRDPEPKVNEARKLGNTQNQSKSNTIATAKKTSQPTNESPETSELSLYSRILTTLVNQQIRISEANRKKEKLKIEQTELETKREAEKARKGTLTTTKLSSAMTPIPSKMQPNCKERTLKPSLRDEVELHGELCEKPVGWADRNRMGLHRIVEDQWRKSLHIEGSDVNVASSLLSTPELTPKD